MFGSHLSVAGGLHHAIVEAKKLGMDCVQVFTKNQRQWKVKPLEPDVVEQWHAARKETGIKHVVSHDSYLINLASPDKDNLKKSRDLFVEEIDRCETLDIPYLVTHPGAHMKEGEEIGLKRVAQSLDAIHKSLPGYKTITLLEITAGQGTALGYTFEHLRSIIDQVKAPERLAVCLDTAHMLAAGYDLTSEKGARATFRELNKVVGLDLIKCIHMNDSKIERGKRVDRHEHIGHGYVSLEAFRVIVNHPKFKKVPKVLETAKEDHPSGKPWDVVNLDVLRGLVKNK